MSEEAPAPRREAPGPNEMRDPLVRQELKRAGVWIGLILGVAALFYLSQPLLLIFGGIVFASMIDGGARLLGRVLPIARGWRITIIILTTLVFLGWTMYFAGSQFAQQAESLRAIIATQSARLFSYLENANLLGEGGANEIGKQIMGSLGRVTTFVGSAIGFVTSAVMILVLGIFFVIEPRSYERGLAWMFPLSSRERIYHALNDMGSTLRKLMAGRLLGMAVEGFGTWILLSLIGMPMAALLGLLTGLLAFLPNIGSIVSGVLIVLVGLSAGGDMVLWAFGVYLIVQMIDGYVIVPMVAKRTVDLAPALVLGAQILLGAAFGFLGLLFADPLVALLKVALEHRSSNQKATAPVGTVAPPTVLTAPTISN